MTLRRECAATSVACFSVVSVYGAKRSNRMTRLEGRRKEIVIPLWIRALVIRKSRGGLIKEVEGSHVAPYGTVFLGFFCREIRGFGLVVYVV